MSQLEERQALDRTEESFRMVSTLQMLLAAFGGTLSAPFRSDTLDFFGGLATVLNSAWFVLTLNSCGCKTFVLWVSAMLAGAALCEPPLLQM